MRIAARVAKIAPIVEGAGEVQSTGTLIRRLARTLDSSLPVEVLRPVRKPRGSLLKVGGLEKEVEAAARRLQGDGGIVVLIDSDDSCPRSLAPILLARARSARSDRPIAVVLAHREYEAWFLEAAASLRGLRGLPADLERPIGSDGGSRAEEIRGAKEWLGRRMGRTYLPTSDQAPLTERFNLTLARRARSFDKCYRDIVAILRELSPPVPATDTDDASLGCARRFDGIRYCRVTGFDPWPGMEHFLLAGAWMLPPEQLWATFARLRTGLSRWGIEQEPRCNGFWRAFRSLFLHVGTTSPPVEYQVRPAEEEWQSLYLPDVAYHLELIQDCHAQTIYENGE